MKTKKEFFLLFFATFLGFIFALLLFFLQEEIKQSRSENILIKNVVFEVEFNIDLLRKMNIEIEKAMRISSMANDTPSATTGIRINSYIKYSHFRYTFLNKLYVSGVLIEHLTNAEIIGMIDMIQRFSLNGETLINNDITQWNKKEITGLVMWAILEIEKKYLLEAIDTLKSVLIKIKKM